MRAEGLPDIVLTGRTRAGKVLCRPDIAPSLGYIVSIGALESIPPSGYGASTATKLRLLFNDVEQDVSPKGGRGCTWDDVARLVTFCGMIKRRPGITLIHCEAGISRSSAATFVLLQVLLGDEHLAVTHLVDIERWCVQRKFRSTLDGDSIRPNRRLVWIADQLLGCSGRLLAANNEAFKHRYSSEFKP